MGKLAFEHAKLIRDCFYTHQDQFHTFNALANTFPLVLLPQTVRENLYFEELMKLMKRENVWIYDTYSEICALERRFCSVFPTSPEPFCVFDESPPILFLISGLKAFFGYHVLDLMAVIQDKAYLRYTSLGDSTLQTDLQNTLKEGKCELIGEPRDVNEAALETFARLASRALASLPKMTIAEKDVERLLAVLFCQSFAAEKVEWDLTVDFIAEVLEKYMETDDPRSKNFKELLGVQLFSLFKSGTLVSDHLRRIGEICIGHYMKQVEGWDLDFVKLKESIDRQEFSKSNLEACELAVKELSTLHDAFRFSELPTGEYQMRTAWETLVKYQWACKMLRGLQD